MTILEEGRHAAEFLNFHLPISLDQVTLLSGESVQVGEVLAKRELDGKYIAQDPLATDGGELAAGIAYDTYDASTGDLQITIVARFAEVDASLVQWPDSTTENDATIGRAALEANLIVFRS